MNTRTGFMILVHAHDHIFKSNWDLSIKLVAMTIIMKAIILEHLKLDKITHRDFEECYLGKDIRSTK